MLTRDHSLVQMLLSRGQITEEQARNHPQRNVVIQAIGLQSQENLQVDQCRGSVNPGEVLMLCTDGISDVLDDATMVEILGTSPNLQACSDRMVNTAVARGGSDNITVVLFQAPPAHSTDPTVVPGKP